MSLEVDIVCVKFYRNIVYVYVSNVLIDDIEFIYYW